MINGFIEGGGWPDAGQSNEPLKNPFEVSLVSVFLFGLVPSTAALLVIVVEIYLWITASTTTTLFGFWGWLSLVCILTEAGLLLAIESRCRRKGIQMRDLIKTSFDYTKISNSKTMKRSWREMIEEMRRLYGSNS